MLALIYLIVMVLLGDSICRRFYAFVWLPHRFAAAFLSGLLISSWVTYLTALLFAQTSQPLLWGNLFYFVAAVCSIAWLRRSASKNEMRRSLPLELTKAYKWDWVIIGFFFIFTSILTFITFNTSDGKLKIANHQWSDYGATVSITQSFALGHNFPTELPHFSGERIRFHFLYYFQVGNLEYLGLNPAYGNNILSVLSLVSMLILVMTLSLIIFRLRAVGRIGALLFFLHGSLYYISFIKSKRSFVEFLNSVLKLHYFLPSGFPYRGEEWGFWTQVVFLNQRHLASSIGILLLVLVFIIIRYRVTLSPEENLISAAEPAENLNEFATSATERETSPNVSWSNKTIEPLTPFVFSGFLLGLMPLWNGAIFIAAVALLGCLFLLFPLKKQMLVLAATSAITAIPQVIFLKTGNIQIAEYSLFHWGYAVENPTIFTVIQYIGLMFGFKWLLILIALLFVDRFQRRLMITVTSLLILAFFFQFSQEILANHKFINVWLVIINLFVAYGLWYLWKLRFLNKVFLGKIAATILVVLIAIGGIIDLFPIYNSYWIEMPLENDPLMTWVQENTDPKAVFLTDGWVNHGILLSGRRLFYGYNYYALSAGYAVGERGNKVYKRMFEERDPEELLRLLHENNISYVVIDNGLRKDDFIKKLNESVFKNNFEPVFQDTQNRYDGLTIYKVPINFSDVPASVLPQIAVPDAFPEVDIAAVSPVNAFKGGLGKDHGQFDKPRGITSDAAGNIYVADLGNARVQKFSFDGEFLAAFGKYGREEGELLEPNGIAVDSAGNIYVADALNHSLIRFKADGTFEKQWNGPAPGFYGPREVAIGLYKQLYVLDQGGNRVVRLDPKGDSVLKWGQSGAGEGEFSDPTGLDVVSDRIFVADKGNNRIQVFDLEGKFIRQWEVPEWDKNLGHFPDVVFDAQANRLYATSGLTNEILVYDADGNRLESIKPAAPDSLDNPSAIVLVEVKTDKRLCVLNTGSGRVTQIKLSKTTP